MAQNMVEIMSKLYHRLGLEWTEEIRWILLQILFIWFQQLGHIATARFFFIPSIIPSLIRLPRIKNDNTLPRTQVQSHTEGSADQDTQKYNTYR